jgi:hypothetical protein
MVPPFSFWYRYEFRIVVLPPFLCYHLRYHAIHICKPFIVEGVVDLFARPFGVYKPSLSQNAQVLGRHSLLHPQLLVDCGNVHLSFLAYEFDNALASAVIQGPQHACSAFQKLSINS